MKLEGKVALVTGSGSGIGRAIAIRFAAEGATVVVNDVAREPAERAASEIGPRASAIVADVTDVGAVRSMFAEVESKLGGLDILVNNAGIGATRQDQIDRLNRMNETRMAELMSGKGIQTHWDLTETLSDEDWDLMIRTHLYGTFYCSREALRLMKRRATAAIVNISSIAGLSGLEAIPHYSAAKAGILGFTRSLALEVGSLGIRVNAICPGFIHTPLADVFSAPIQQALTARTPLGRWGQPEEIAATALFLASEESSFYTGQWLSPNGGMVMQ